MLFRNIKRMFKDGNVCVVGLRGRGKDMLFANVVARRKLPYVSNTDYKVKCKMSSKAKFLPLELPLLDCGGNTYENFISGDIKKYVYPYADKTDIYLADVGVYFPSQYCGELNKKYKQFPVFMALSRQLGQCNVHFNTQNLNRCWDKIREQSDQYIECRKCRVIFGFVFQWVTIYEKYESCVNRVPPFKFKLGFFAKREMKNMLQIEKQKYKLQHGEIKKAFLLYRNKSNYNTRIFKEILENGK